MAQYQLVAIAQLGVSKIKTLVSFTTQESEKNFGTRGQIVEIVAATTRVWAQWF